MSPSKRSSQAAAEPGKTPIVGPILSVGSDGDAVRRLHAALLDLEIPFTDDELVAGFYGRSTRAAVLSYQRSHGLATSGAVDVDTVAALDLNNAPGRLRVVGRVVDPDLSAVAGVVVSAFDRDLRTEQQLGQTKTDNDGYFVISYTAENFARAEKETADVFVRVLDGRRIVYDPPVEETLYNAGPLVGLTITLANLLQPRTSEFEQITAALKPLLLDIEVQELREDAQHRDVTFLAGETGLPADHLAYYVLSHQLVAQADVPPYYFFALLCENTLDDVTMWRSLRPRFVIDLSTPLDGLFDDIVLLSSDTVRVAVGNAIAAAVVPSTLARQLPGILRTMAALQTKAAARLREQVPQLLAEQLHDILASPAPDTISTILADPNVGDLTALLDRLVASGSIATPAAKLDARTRAAIAELIGNQPGIVARVARKKRITAPEDAYKLASMNPADWVQALTPDAKKLGLSGGAVTRALIRSHASSLARTLESRFPTAAFAAQLARDASGPHNKQVAAVLAKNPTFDLATGNVTRLVKAGRAKQSGTDPVVAGLRSAQRVFKVAPRYRQAAALLNQGVRSAADVHRMGRQRFVAAAVAGGEFTAAEAHAAYRRAADIHAGSLVLGGQLAAMSAATSVAALSAGPPSMDLEPVTLEFPNMQSLFLLGDMCECDDCRSVDGAAAYVADTLQFISHRLVTDTTVTPNVTIKAARDELFARRPDLGDTDLSCPNTNTPLPYIDVVCELLEEAVAPDPGFAFAAATVPPGVASSALVAALAAHGLPATASAVVYEADLAGAVIVRDVNLVCKLTPAGAGTWAIRVLRQTNGSADTVAAAPEYVNLAAYATLAASTAAFTLPFDLPHQESLSYFSVFGVDRAALMSALTVAGNPSPAQIAAETLGLSPAQHQLIVTPNPAGQQAIWNTPTANASATLNNVDAFVTRTGLPYTDLLDLLTSQWLNPGDTMFVRHLDNTADLTAKQIENLDDAALDRIHRFQRLRACSGWSIDTLDRAIRANAIGAGLLDDGTVAAVVAINQLAASLGLTVDAVCDLLAPLDPTLPAPATYGAVFLNVASLGTVDPAFTATALAANEAAEIAVPGSGVKLAAVADPLGLALGRSGADVAVLLELVGAGAVLSVDSLSAAYAYARLGTAMSMSLLDLQALLELSSIPALASPHDMLDVLAARDALNGIAPTDVTYVLAHSADNLAQRELPAATVDALLTALAQAYGTAATANASPFDPDATPTENTAAMRATLGRLPGVTGPQLSSAQTLVLGVWTDPVTTPAQFINALLAGFFDTTAVQAAVAAMVGAVPITDALRNASIKAITDGASTALYTMARQAALHAALTTTLTVADDLTDVILANAHLKQPVIVNPPTLGEILLDPTVAPLDPTRQAAVTLFNLIATVVAGTALASADVTWLLQNASALGWIELDALPYEVAQTAQPFAGWTAFQAFLTFLAAYPAVADPTNSTVSLTATGLFSLVINPTTTAVELVTYFGGLAGLDPVALGDLDAHFGFSTPDLTAYLAPTTFGRLATAASLLRQLGVDVADGVEVATPALTAADAAMLRAALKSRYSDADWLGVLQQAYDTVRPGKRDALVAYLLATNSALSSADDLYDYFLIDVEMGPCMQTSRVVQMHATIQLFAMRCLMGIEPTCVASIGADDGWQQWQWMANFRVWQANREIFLWPENWIEPDLRDDKTELFVNLDNTLQQDQLTTDSVEDATAAYLESLDDIARLEVMATYYQSSNKHMHVFARTKGGSPSVYYHREFVEESYWTPWTTVPLDIDSDHLLAFERNSRLTLAWAIFTSQPDTDAPPPPIPDPASLGGGRSNDPPSKQWQIRLATSEQSRGKWRPKKVSRGYLATAFSTALPDKSYFNLFSWTVGASQAITCLGPDGFSGSFALTGCKGYPEPEPTSSLHAFFSPQFKDSALRTNRFVELNQDSDDQLAMRSVFSSVFDAITQNTPGTFTVTYPLQMTIVDWVILFVELWVGSQTKVQGAYTAERSLQLPLGTLMPFFYDDSDRTYVIVPGFYERKEGLVADGTSKTFSTVEQDVEDTIALLVKYLKLYQQDPTHDLAHLVTQLLQDSEYLRLRKEFESYRALRYGLRYENFYHPLVCMMRSALDASGVPGLMSRDLQLTDTGFDFGTVYEPSSLVVHPYPRENLDFDLDGAYSVYNWEMFFHLPFDVATRLRRDNQFELARDWFHYVFNPVGSGDLPAPQRYWITKPFTVVPGDYLAERIDTIMGDIAADPSGATITALAFAVEQWRENPFDPDVVARSRPVAYQMALVTNYIGNLVDWGDSLFRQFTRESITQATQLYVLADKLLGPKPRIIPPALDPPVMTYNQLEANLDLFGNAFIDLENIVPDLNLLPHHGAELPPAPITLGTLYFCIPPNDNLLQLWDLVADRLTKIRACQNIDGVQASLALFSPPIDPGALIRAAAAGIDVSAFLAGLGAPLPPYRFQTMSAKATELTQHVAALGAELLAALEKSDAEAMARMHEDQETKVLAAVRTEKVAAITEATGAMASLQKSRIVTETRQQYYAGQSYMNAWEIAAVSLNGLSLLGEAAVSLGYILAGGLSLIPAFMAGGAGFGGSPTVTVTLGGQEVGAAADKAADVLQSLTRVADKGAGMASVQAGFQRRSDEWTYQVNLATKELDEIDQQIATAQLHIDTLQADLVAHDQQIANAAQTTAYLYSKFTKQELYDWISGQLKSVYYSAYQLAFDTAKKAERCLDHELGTDATFISYGYWDSSRQGLMTADALLHDIKRMEAAYLDMNKREYELTKHVSLTQLDPQALLTLKNTGQAFIELPEAMFDTDHPGHYRRRIKTVSISIPCVAGPYTTVACTLSQVGNRYRQTTANKQGAATDLDKYLEQDGSDPRFVYNVGTIQSIATSSAVADSGLFELNFHDERYLPFEGTGAVSRWLIEIPQEFPQFDHATISDVVIHLRYTAQDGGTAFTNLVQGVTAKLLTQMTLANGQGLYAGVSLRTRFPDVWWQLVQNGTATLTVDEQVLPFATQGHHPVIDSAGWYAKLQGNPATYALDVGGTALNLTKNVALGNLYTAVGGTVALGTPVTLTANATTVDDLVLLVHYTIT